MSIDGECEHLSNADLDVEMRTSEVAAGPGGGQTSCRIMLWSSKSNYGRLESLIIDESKRPTRCSTVLSLYFVRRYQVLYCDPFENSYKAKEVFLIHIKLNLNLPFCK